MANRTHSERREAGQDVLRTLRGGKVDGATAAAANEARLGALGSYVTDFALGDIWSRPGLSRRDRSLVVITIASFFLVLDFDFIEQGIARGAPKHLEWYAGFSILVTLVWIYLEILNLLQKIYGKSRN